MLRVARSILPHHDLASDAVQEALVCLCHQPELPRDLQGWLVRATVHRCRHHLRSSLRRLRHETLAALDRSRARTSGDVEALAEHDVVRAIERAIDDLSQPYGAAFRLREFDGLEYREIARRLGVPIGTVRSRLARAKRQLRATVTRITGRRAPGSRP
jgi:RNA polymerase sigma-70 factor (ECF subfamily)